MFPRNFKQFIIVLFDVSGLQNILSWKKKIREKIFSKGLQQLVWTQLLFYLKIFTDNFVHI